MNKIKEWISANKDSIVKPVVVLFCICLVISLALAAANAVTAPKIASLSAKQQKEAMARLIQADDYEENKIKTDGDEFTYYVAIASGEVAGYVFVTSEKGYGGDVSVMTAVKPDGEIIAVDILDVSNETPGLGQNAAKESFYGQFAGLSDKINLVKNPADGQKNTVQAVTGATITSTAVTKAVNQAISLYQSITEEESSQSSVETGGAEDADDFSDLPDSADGDSSVGTDGESTDSASGFGETDSQVTTDSSEVNGNEE